MQRHGKVCSPLQSCVAELDEHLQLASFSLQPWLLGAFNPPANFDKLSRIIHSLFMGAKTKTALLVSAARKFGPIVMRGNRSCLQTPMLGDPQGGETGPSDTFVLRRMRHVVVDPATGWGK